VYFSADGVAAIARVEVLFGAGDRVAVRSDQLKPGMDVVVVGNERLFPGQPLAPIAPSTPSPKPHPTSGPSGGNGASESRPQPGER
jgi:hypothetical protein